MPGGKAVVVSAYAPHTGYSYADRQHFFSTLAGFVNGQSAHGPKVICGDMNARIYRRQPGEEEAFGDFYLHSVEATISEDANRYLLYEFCEATSTFSANTCFLLLAENLVTCYNVGAQPIDEINWRNHGQIDYVLAPRQGRGCIVHVYSDRSVPLPSHHFVLITELAWSVPKAECCEKRQVLNYEALNEHRYQVQFWNRFNAFMEESVAADTNDINLKYAAMVDGVRESAEATLPKRKVGPRQPWIRETTLHLLEDRSLARAQGLFAWEQALNKQIRAAVREDRSIWLDNLVASSSWDIIRKLRKGCVTKQGRLRKSNGDMASSEERADVLAKYLEEVQWAVRPATVMPDRAPLNPELPIESGDITMGEVMFACKRLRKNRAAGVDNVPAEIWKSLASPDSHCAHWMLDLCQNCWEQKMVPDMWHDSRTGLT